MALRQVLLSVFILSKGLSVTAFSLYRSFKQQPYHIGIKTALVLYALTKSHREHFVMRNFKSLFYQNTRMLVTSCKYIMTVFFSFPIFLNVFFYILMSWLVTPGQLGTKCSTLFLQYLYFKKQLKLKVCLRLLRKQGCKHHGYFNKRIHISFISFIWKLT